MTASTCSHDESLWGRCVSCGMTWDEQRGHLPIATARLAKFHDARRHFESGGTVLVSEHGYDEIPVTRSTTVHTSVTTSWADLAQTVREWRSRYPGQRFYIVGGAA